eukprot:TRINITY_DN13344_c0_g1_i3.p1 TRINITY_DN13344_c0_g1~~TRINITY_DN13344_c0_g1_i3.p1  ORF type:complete len:106 (+),score=14.19 TRINITY_DN13344_c0_g1_i3:202-519(+)
MDAPVLHNFLYQDKLLLTTKRKIKVPKLQLSCLHKKGIAGKKYTVLESSSTKALTGDLKFGEPKKTCHTQAQERQKCSRTICQNIQNRKNQGRRNNNRGTSSLQD